jgi:hypothetical protein
MWKNSQVEKKEKRVWDEKEEVGWEGGRERERENLNRGHHWEIAREEKKRLCLDIVFKYCWSAFFHFYFPSWWKFCYFYTVTEQMELWLRDHNVYSHFDVLLTILSHFWQAQFFFSPGKLGGKAGSPDSFICSELGPSSKPLWIVVKLQRRQPRPWGSLAVGTELLWRMRRVVGGGIWGLLRWWGGQY